MMLTSMKLFAMALALIGPPPKKGAPKDLQIKAGQQIVAIGDSITQAGGYLKAIDAVFAQQYPDLKIPPVINAGISGQKAEDLVKRFDKDVVQRKPAIVTISIGINDVWHRVDKPADPKVLAAYGENVEKMVVMAQDAKIKVLLLAPTVINEDPKSEGNVRLAEYVKAGKAIARKHKCAYVDLHAMFLRAVEKTPATMPAGAAKASETSASQKAGESPAAQRVNRFTADGVHMKPLGDAMMAAGVLRALGVPDEKIAATDLGKIFPKAK
jgi:acyl-CoA thioesterase I